MRRRVVFRADGNRSLGLGHLYRCLALSEMIELLFDSIFCFVEAPAAFLSNLEQKAVASISIRSNNELLSICREGDILVWDNYEMDRHLFFRLKEQGVKLVLIDDFLRADSSVDLIINHAPGVAPSDYHQAGTENTRFALGLHYAILQRPFLDAAVRRQGKRNPNGLLICFGGADPEDWTIRSTLAVYDNPRINSIDVVVGTAYDHLASITELRKLSGKVNLFRGLSPSEMVERMTVNTFALVPSSTILYEALSLSMLCISFPYVDNQEGIFRGFRDLGVITAVDDPNELSGSVDHALTNRTDVESRLPVIDGFSGERIVELFKSLVA